MLHDSMQGYMAHGYCFAWEPALVWLHVISDVITGLAYYSIPIALFYFAYKRRDLPFLSMFVLFGVFIFACGTTHLSAAVTVFTPRYWEEGMVKAFTAVVSGVSAILFIPLLPKAIAMPSLKKALDEIKLLNRTLGEQVDELRIKESAIASSANPIAFADLDGHITYVNNAFLELWGYNSKDEVLGGPISSFLESAEYAESLIEEVRKNGNWGGELPAKRKDGVIFVSEVKWSIVLNESGSPICFMGLFTDITERRKNDEALRAALKRIDDERAKSEAIIAAIGDGISIQDTGFKVIYQNQVSKNLLGDHVGELCHAVYERTDTPCKGCPVEMSFMDGGIHTVERCAATGGKIKYFEVTASVLRDSEGKIIAGIEVLRDLTERKHLESQLRHAQKMEAVGTLAGGIAHDFNNILNVISGFGVLVMDRIGDDQLLRQHMTEVLAAADRATDLTRRLLVFSRKQVADVKPVNINETILGIRKMVGRIIRENIDFNLNLADSPLMVLADPGQIEQVLINLASNASDAMPEGGRLTIGTVLQELDEEYVAAYGYGKPGWYVLITVSDTGHGMDEETQKKIFEPFFTTKDIGEGTGLGLAISYGIIKQHNGYIRVYSEQGKGTTFKIYLPFIGEPAVPAEQTQAPAAVRGGSEAILVAEDDASTRKLTRTVLESLGYSVITAEDGEDAIVKFMENRERIDLVVLDMIMPKKNGKEVSEAIRKVSPGAKILFVSGYTMDIIKTRDITEAGFDFILKPVRAQDLLRSVRELLDR